MKQVNQLLKRNHKNPYFLFEENGAQINPSLAFIFCFFCRRTTITCVFTLALFSWMRFLFCFYFLLLFSSYSLHLSFLFSSWASFFLLSSQLWRFYFECHALDPGHIVLFTFSFGVICTWLYDSQTCWRLSNTNFLRCVRIKYLGFSDYKRFSREFFKHAKQRWCCTMHIATYMCYVHRLNVHKHRMQMLAHSQRQWLRSRNIQTNTQKLYIYTAIAIVG